MWIKSWSSVVTSFYKTGVANSTLLKVKKRRMVAINWEHKIIQGNIPAWELPFTSGTIQHRIALTKLRTSCLKLAIETGLYRKPAALPINYRLCWICNIIEDEVHLVSVCVSNANLRSKLFISIAGLYSHFGSLNSAEKLVQLKESAI